MTEQATSAYDDEIDRFREIRENQRSPPARRDHRVAPLDWRINLLGASPIGVNHTTTSFKSALWPSSKQLTDSIPNEVSVSARLRSNALSVS